MNSQTDVLILKDGLKRGMKSRMAGFLAAMDIRFEQHQRSIDASSIKRNVSCDKSDLVAGRSLFARRIRFRIPCRSDMSNLIRTSSSHEVDESSGQKSVRVRTLTSREEIGPPIKQPRANARLLILGLRTYSG